MRKFLAFLVVGIMLLGSVTALADSIPYDQHKNDGGVITEWNLTYEYFLDYNRSYQHLDINDPAYASVQPMCVEEPAYEQEAKVTLKADAYIPCYLELRVRGNGGEGIAESYGPDAVAGIGPGNNWWMLFDNEVGGFVNENWASLGHGKNAEVKPAANTFITACDRFVVDVWSNDTYKYMVESAPLKTSDADTTVAGDSLPLFMRSKSKVGDEVWSSWSDAEFDATEAVTIEAEVHATVGLKAQHEFKVPYTRDYAHGSYTGAVTFRAVTI